MSSDILDEDNLAITRVMLEGLTRADQALGELADALREREEPTVVVFFGDHRPNLFMTDGGTVYSHLGLCEGNNCADWTIEQVADLYSTNYLIWANDAALLKAPAGTVQDTGIAAIGPGGAGCGGYAPYPLLGHAGAAGAGFAYQHGSLLRHSRRYALLEYNGRGPIRRGSGIAGTARRRHL